MKDYPFLPSARLRSSLLINPAYLFVYAQAFRFSSGRGRCFSPGFKALCHWYRIRLQAYCLDRSALHWWRVWLGRV